MFFWFVVIGSKVCLVKERVKSKYLKVFFVCWKIVLGCSFTFVWLGSIVLVFESYVKSLFLILYRVIYFFFWVCVEIYLCCCFLKKNKAKVLVFLYLWWGMFVYILFRVRKGVSSGKSFVNKKVKRSVRGVWRLGVK